MTFSREIKIRFQHCDPAGIVFYPRYFEMLNQMVEDWFEEALGTSFQALHVEQNLGVPTVRVECDFIAATRIGEVLRFDLRLVNIGRKSFKFVISASEQQEERLRASLTLVCVGLGETLQSEEIPTSLRSRMEPYLEKASA